MELALSELTDRLVRRYKLGDEGEVMRRLRYFTTEGLLETVGSINTGSGKKRLYPASALIAARILLRLDEIGATVGKMRDYLTALRVSVEKQYETKDLDAVCSELERPTVVFSVPSRRYRIGLSGRLLDWDDALDSIPRQSDAFIVIRLNRSL